MRKKLNNGNMTLMREGWTALALFMVVVMLFAAPTWAQENDAAAADATAVEGDVVVDDIPPEPEEPEEAPRVRIDRYDTSVQIFSGLTVRENEVYRDAVVILGPLTVHGEVEGDAVAVGGPVEVTGTVGGELVSVGGNVTLGPDAEVGQLVNIGGDLDKHQDAVVHDEIQNVGSGFSIEIDGDDIEIGTDDIGRRVREHVHERVRSPFYRIAKFFGGLAWKLVSFAFLVFLLAVAAVLAPKLLDRAESKLQDEGWKAALAGFLAVIGFVPALIAGTLLLVITIVGIFLIPIFVPLVALAFVAALVVGFAASAQAVGSLVASRFNWNAESRFVRIALGAAALYVIGFIGWMLGMMPFMGPVAWLMKLVGGVIVAIAWITGLGALLLAAFDPPQGNAQSPAQTLAQPAPPPVPDFDDDSSSADDQTPALGGETGGQEAE